MGIGGLPCPNSKKETVMSNLEDPKASQAQEKPKLTGSLGQQILVAVLVVAVGVLFGMGPVLGNPAPANRWGNPSRD